MDRDRLATQVEHARERAVMFEGFERKVVSVDGLDISCVIGGEGTPVLLLHGFPQSMAMWARVAPQLAKQFTVVCADLRGYGDSAKPKCLPDRSNYSFRVMARDQLGLMRKLGFERFHMVGHDRGGRTGHRMALDHPEAVMSLCVIDIVPTYAMSWTPTVSSRALTGIGISCHNRSRFPSD